MVSGLPTTAPFRGFRTCFGRILAPCAQCMRGTCTGTSPSPWPRRRYGPFKGKRGWPRRTSGQRPGQFRDPWAIAASPPSPARRGWLHQRDAAHLRALRPARRSALGALSSPGRSSFHCCLDRACMAPIGGTSPALTPIGFHLARLAGCAIDGLASTDRAPGFVASRRSRLRLP